MKLPRILIAGISSGSGKTTVTCGILQALKKRGYQLAASKCGPDYIDPMFHETVLQIPANNLDSFFCEEAVVRNLFAENAEDADLAVIEGVMGYYDGMGLDTVRGSSYEIARITKTPVILVVNGKGMGMTLLPVIQGMLEFKKDSNIRGIILNGISRMLCDRLKPIIEEKLNVEVIGNVPKLSDFHLESRHLGLVTPSEISDIRGQLEKLGQVVEENLNLECLIRIAKEAEELGVTKEAEESAVAEKTGALAGAREKELEEANEPVRIGIARDKAFCFYYKDNLRLLEKLGCELVDFSPLNDMHLPENLHGILLGGGYPELYAKELSENRTMRADIRNALEKNLPCMAECGGFMYLHERMEGKDNRKYPMTGFLSGESFRTGKLVRFGYVELEALEDSGFQKEGERIRGHEFHYWDSTDAGEVYLAKKPVGEKVWKCCQVKKNVLAGYPHLHYYSNIEFARGFVNTCRAYAETMEVGK